VDWFSRRVLSWRLSITVEAAFCMEAVEEALARYDTHLSSFQQRLQSAGKPKWSPANSSSSSMQKHATRE
jgi:transposase InsO family protein